MMTVKQWCKKKEKQVLENNSLYTMVQVNT